MLHQGNNDNISIDSIPINEFVLVCNQERYVTGNTSSVTYDYKKLKINEKGTAIPDSKYLYISVTGLCREIVEAAEQYMATHQKDKVFPKIKKTNRGGKVPDTLF